MKTQISGPACAPRLRYRAHVGAKRAWFFAAPVDLTALVIAESIKRRAQAELQRPALRDAYELPVSHERTDARDASIRPPESGDAD